MNNHKKIKISEIVSFKNHPFQVNNDETLKELSESIKNNGLINPVIVRKIANNKYEMISGHRRKAALELLGEKEIDAYIMNLTDDEATIYMVDSNIYRDKILPSEKAFAYKMKLDAIKHQGKKTSTTKLSKCSSSEIIGNDYGESREQVRKYIRLTYLISDLLDLVDNTVKYDKRTFLTMGLKPAVELSYLTKDEQNLVYSAITYEDLTPSHAQAIKIRDLSKNKKLNYNSIEEIFQEKKGNQNETISFNKDKILSALPSEMLKRDKRYVEEYIINAIKEYKKINKSVKDDFDLNRLDF